MKIYVARHGKTSWNDKFIVCGRTDVELNQEGIKQAEILALEAKTCNIDIIISSPLKRAYDTAMIVAKECSLDVLIDDRLIEQNYGKFEGVSGHDEAFLANKRCFAYKYPGGESMMQMAYRVYGLLEELKEKYYEKNVLLVCHGGVCRVIRTYFEDMTNEEYFSYNEDNAKLVEYEC